MIFNNPVKICRGVCAGAANYQLFKFNDWVRAERAEVRELKAASGGKVRWQELEGEEKRV